MDIILVGGLWLDASAWDQVVPHLEALGHRAVPVRLPGQGDGATTATLEGQITAVTAAVDAAVDRPVVIGHSAASTLAWLAADRRPDRVAAVGLIGGFPSDDGERYAAFFPAVDGVMAFPGWEPFAGPDSDDLDDAAKARIEAAAIPVPEGVTTGAVAYHDERRFEVPVTVICPEFSPTQAKEWIESGDVPELAAATTLGYVDIDSGHWPMFSAPEALAQVIDAVATRAART